MRALKYRPHQRASDRYRLSGGVLPRDLSGAQRLALYLQQRRMRAEFYRRQAPVSASAPSSGDPLIGLLRNRGEG